LQKTYICEKTQLFVFAYISMQKDYITWALPCKCFCAFYHFYFFLTVFDKKKYNDFEGQYSPK